VTLEDLRTPCVLVDWPRAERNIARMQTLADPRGLRLRPHAKTHKSLDVARSQIARGAVGICCAKLGEAEVFAAGGIADIRLPYPLHPSNADRLVNLLDKARISFIVDNLDVAKGWSRALREADREVDVLVKVDVGLHRCGIDPHAHGAAGLVAEVSALPGLRFRGLLSHAGHAYGAASDLEIAGIAAEEARVLTTLKEAVQALGVECPEISVGATPTARHSATLDGITELRPGNYVYYDRMQVALGAATWDDCALTVLARVVSRPAADRLILDSGSKTLTNDLVRGNNRGYGVILEALDAATPDTSLVIERLSEEHAVVTAPAACTLNPGALVRVVPNHSCVVSNLVDAAWRVSGTEVLGPLEIAARGRIA
jgi:D-serine deaminase-like pyridoxal phosphate-dependent protein